MAAANPNSMTSLLAKFGVKYDKAPAPTPAMLAFMRGLGMTLDSAKDQSRKNEARLKERATGAREEITRQNERTMGNMAASQAERGVLSSGETNTRVGEQAENVAKSTGEVEQALAEGIDATNSAYKTTEDALRQQALEKTLNMETDQAREKATSAAEERSYKRQQAAADKAYAQQKAANDAAYAAQEALYKKYNMGV